MVCFIMWVGLGRGLLDVSCLYRDSRIHSRLADTLQFSNRL
jgi:hypothetical protein